MSVRPDKVVVPNGNVGRIPNAQRVRPGGMGIEPTVCRSPRVVNPVAFNEQAGRVRNVNSGVVVDSFSVWLVILPVEVNALRSDSTVTGNVAVDNLDVGAVVELNSVTASAANRHAL